MATDYWVVVNADASTYKVLPTAVGSAADNALKSSNPQATVNGTDWIALSKPYPTQAAANAALPGIENFEKTGKGPGTPTVPPFALGPNQPAGQAAQKAAGTNPLSGLAAIGDFFSRLTDATTWIRVGKVLVGGVLLIVGLAHMTGADNAAFKAARNVPIPV